MDAIARARGWLVDLFAHNYAGQLRIAREVQRKNMGLQQVDMPYPGSSQDASQTTINQTGNGWLKGAVVGAALLGGGTAAGIGAMQSLQKTPAVVAPMPPVDPRTAYDAIYEQQQPDGTWVEVRRERLK